MSKNLYISPSGDNFVELAERPEGYFTPQEYHNRFFPPARSLSLGEILSVYEPNATIALMLRAWHNNLDAGYSGFVDEVKRFIPGFGIRTAYAARQRMDKELTRIGARLPYMRSNRERLIREDMLRLTMKEIHRD